MSFLTKFTASALMSVAMIASANNSALAADLQVEVSGITQVKGEILLALFDQKGRWLRTAAMRTKTAATGDKVVLIFSGLAEGEYAISAFQDLNGNGDLDRNLIGIPSEPYGFSNDAMGNFGPPSFEDAKIKMDAQNKSIRIRLN